MAILQRINAVSNQRLDLPAFDLIDKFTTEDINMICSRFLTDSSKIVAGFIPYVDIECTSQAFAGAEGLKLYFNLKDSTLIHSNGKDIPFFFTGYEGMDVDVVQLEDNATNFVEVDLSFYTGIPGSVAIWDNTLDGNTGRETSQVIDTVKILKADITSNTVGFSGGHKMSILEVRTENGSIVSVKDKRNMFFRLASAEPYDATRSYAWSQGTAEAPEECMGNKNAFTSGDKGIKTLKEFFDAVMTEIKRIKGSSYWFSPGSSGQSNLSLSNLFFDTASSVINGTGEYQHKLDDNGQSTLVWTSPIFLKSTIGDLFYKINQSPEKGLTLLDKQVAYIKLVRDSIANSDFKFNESFTYQSPEIPGGNTYVPQNKDNNIVIGEAGAFTDFMIGDWIKLETHDSSAWRKIIEYQGQYNPDGTPSGNKITSAKFVVLDQPYTGGNEDGKALRCQGEYSVEVKFPKEVEASGNIFWLAKRDDNGETNKPRIYIRDAGELELWERREIGDNTALNIIDNISFVIDFSDRANFVNRELFWNGELFAKDPRTGTKYVVADQSFTFPEGHDTLLMRIDQDANTATLVSYDSATSNEVTARDIVLGTIQGTIFCMRSGKHIDSGILTDNTVVCPIDVPFDFITGIPGGPFLTGAHEVELFVNSVRQNSVRASIMEFTDGLMIGIDGELDIPQGMDMSTLWAGMIVRDNSNKDYSITKIVGNKIFATGLVAGMVVKSIDSVDFEEVPALDSKYGTEIQFKTSRIKKGSILKIVTRRGHPNEQ